MLGEHALESGSRENASVDRTMTRERAPVTRIVEPLMNRFSAFCAGRPVQVTVKPHSTDHRCVACRTCGAKRWAECVDLEAAESNTLFTGHASRRAAVIGKEYLSQTAGFTGTVIIDGVDMEDFLGWAIRLYGQANVVIRNCPIISYGASNEAANSAQGVIKGTGVGNSSFKIEGCSTRGYFTSPVAVSMAALPSPRPSTWPMACIILCVWTTA